MAKRLSGFLAVLLATLPAPLLSTVFALPEAQGSTPLVKATAGSSPWTRPTVLARTRGSRGYVASLGLASDGTAIALWRSREGIRIRERSTDNALGPTQPVSPAEHRGLVRDVGRVAVGNDGTALAMWTVGENRSGIPAGRYVRMRFPDGQLGPVRQLDGETSIDSAALTLFGPTDGMPRILTSRFARSYEEPSAYLLHLLDPAGNLIDQPMLSARRADVSVAAVDRAGNAVIVWQQDDRFERVGTGDVRIFATTLSREGVLGAPQTVATMGMCCLDPAMAVAVNASGRGHVVWTQPATLAAPERLQARSISTSGSLGPVSTLARGLSLQDDASVASFSDGRSLVVWSVFEQIQSTDPEHLRPERFPVRGRVLTAHGALTLPS